MKKINVIAEIGINHNGSIKLAKDLIDVAVLSGCEYAKFQKRTPDICVPEKQKSKLRETPWGKIPYIDYKKKIEFEQKEYDELWIIGGEQIYKEFLINNKTDNIYLTNVVGATLSDAYFPFIPKNFKETYRSKDLIYKDLSYFYQKFENMD